ncbi:MAG: hypothetical protein GTO24_10870 [candidate division Zixibacteria bacterium]|nr:hypothetical protein [candidate division Zixibacteria bacterium]
MLRFSKLLTLRSPNLSVTFYEGQGFKERAEERAHLVEVEGDQVCARLARARGHCNKITNIYQKYLSTWLDKVLTPQESQDLRELFEALQESDAKMVEAIREISWWLSEPAEETLLSWTKDKYNRRTTR